MSKSTPAKPAASGDQDPRIGVYVCHCGLNIAQSVDCRRVAQTVENEDGVIISKDIVYACSEPGQQQIKQDIIDNGLDRVVIGSCSPRLHEATFKKMIDSVGLNPYMLDMANLREQCSWVHQNDKDNATLKAETLVNMSIARVRSLEPLHEETLPLTAKTLVIGGGIAGIQAALDLADCGYDVTLVEKNPSIGGIMAQIDKTFPTMDCSI
jgi:heterodisulfide reductase subunit A-like polyferredoxin